TGVSAMCAGYGHSLYLKSDGTLWAMGYNFYGQLGDGTRADSLTPIQVASGVSAVAAGESHSLYLKTDGTLWTTGLNNYGQLGDGTSGNKRTPVQVASGVRTVAAGNWHSLYLKTDGTLWAMGNNSNGEFGNGTTGYQTSPVQVASGVVAATAGGNHSLYMISDGSLRAMGWNDYGQLGDTTTIQRNSSVPVARSTTAVVAGNNHSLYLKIDGTLWAMGSNDSGQLGDGTMTERDTPVQVATGVRTAALLGVYDSIAITSQPQVTWLTTTSLQLSVSNTGTVSTYQWNKDGAAISGATGSTYTIGSASAGSAGIYTVTLGNPLQSVTSDAMVLSLANPGAPTNAVAAVGDSQLTVSFVTPSDTGGAPISSYTVTATPAGGGAAITATGVTSPITVIGMTNGTAYTITVTATNLYGTGSSCSAGSSVTPYPPPAITTQPASQTVNQGGSVTFSVTASGTAPLTYQWSKGGVALNGVVGASYTIVSTSATDAGNYSVTVTNGAGSVTSS
ncbi:MAG: immunoglobulin domain-containing protein, partial [Opitutaceae bacterium]